MDCVILVILTKDLKVLLIQSDLEEFSGLNSLLGDLVRPDEDLDASYRILKERALIWMMFLPWGSHLRKGESAPLWQGYPALYSIININSHKLKIVDNDLNWHSVKISAKLTFDHKEMLETCLAHLQQGDGGTGGS